MPARSWGLIGTIAVHLVLLHARPSLPLGCCVSPGQTCLDVSDAATCTDTNGTPLPGPCNNTSCTGQGTNPCDSRCLEGGRTCTTAADCDDGNACTTDACVAGSPMGAFVCNSTPVANGTTCNDADFCTINDACRDGACGGTNVCHFLCYETNKQAFSSIPGVTLTDQFESATVTVEAPVGLCPPVDKNGEAPGAESAPTHLVAYRNQPQGPRFMPVRDQVMEDQFGIIAVDAIRASRLLVPSSKSLAGPPPPLSSATGAFIDHFRCYDVRRSRRAPRFTPIPNVTLVDQFGTTTVRVLRPRLLCNPVDKNGESPGAEEHAVRLMCYQIVSGTAVNMSSVPLFVNNQFGQQTVQVEHREMLCLQARGPVQLDHFKYYDAKVPKPPKKVTLKDQFLEEEVELNQDGVGFFMPPVVKSIVVDRLRDPTTHMTCYHIDKGDKTKRMVRVRNQYSKDKDARDVLFTALNVSDADSLCVPTEKDEVPSELKRNHFKCYLASGKTADTKESLSDQFFNGIEGAHRVKVTTPFLFCNPVTRKAYDSKDENPLKDARDHLTCYKFEKEGPAPDPPKHKIKNQFHEDEVEIRKSKGICIQSTKLTTTTTTTLP